MDVLDRLAEYYQSAGGYVVHKGRVLLVRKNEGDEVRMPKGHVEEDESPAEAAMREVREETGYASLRVVADLGKQQSRFWRRGVWTKRDEFAFLMELTDEATVERDAADTKRFTPVWTTLEEAERMLTFDTEREFLRRARRWLAGRLSTN